MKQETQSVAEMGLVGMPTFVHRGANGEIKKLWNNNKIGSILLAFFPQTFSKGKLFASLWTENPLSFWILGK